MKLHALGQLITPSARNASAAEAVRMTMEAPQNQMLVRKLLSTLKPLFFAISLFLLLYQLFESHVEGDQAFYLYAAQRVLEGVHLDGPRLVETNPPLIIWFSEIPVVLSRLLHLSPVLALRLVVLAILAGTALWTRRLMRLCEVKRQLGPTATNLLWVVMSVTMVLIQPAEFGQREQLQLALLLPYVLAVGTGAVLRMGIPERIGLGLAAGLAVCFKPHHLLTLLCLELFLALSRRTLRRLLSPELLASIAAGLTYVVAVRLATPEYLQTIVPLLNSTYWALGQFSLFQMAVHISPLLTLTLLLCIATWLGLSSRLTTPQVSGAFLAAAVGATLAYFVQHTGWYHQVFTAVALFEIAAAWIAVDWLCSTHPAVMEFATAGRGVWTVCLVGALVAFGSAHHAAGRHATHPGTMFAELETLPEHTTVYVFSVGMNQFPTVLERHLEWGSRFAHLWMMPAIVANESRPDAAQHPPARVLPPERVAELASIQRTELTEDLNRTMPEMVFVEQCDRHRCATYTGPFDAVKWFSESPAFTAMWSHYRFSKEVDGFDVYVRQ
jgi:hypothetical protein